MGQRYLVWTSRLSDGGDNCRGPRWVVLGLPSGANCVGARGVRSEHLVGNACRTEIASISSCGCGGYRCCADDFDRGSCCGWCRECPLVLGRRSHFGRAWAGTLLLDLGVGSSLPHQPDSSCVDLWWLDCRNSRGGLRSAALPQGQ